MNTNTQSKITHHCEECGAQVSEFCEAHPKAAIASAISRPTLGHSFRIFDAAGNETTGTVEADGKAIVIVDGERNEYATLDALALLIGAARCEYRDHVMVEDKSFRFFVHELGAEGGEVLYVGAFADCVAAIDDVVNEL